jgi:hypothetical protein
MQISVAARGGWSQVDPKPTSAPTEIPHCSSLFATP